MNEKKREKSSAVESENFVFVEIKKKKNERKGSANQQDCYHKYFPEIWLEGTFSVRIRKRVKVVETFVDVGGKPALLAQLKITKNLIALT